MGSRSIIVTGGFGVLGRAVAAAFAEQGDKVACIDAAPAAGGAIPGALDFASVDLTDVDACIGVVETVKSTFGGVDVLVNVAGGFIWETVADGHERRKPELLAVIPALGDHLRANAGRIADRDCEWCQGRRGHSRL